MRRKIDSIVKRAHQTLDTLYKKDSKKRRKASYGERECLYPGCTKTFIATSWSQKYCKEHQQTALLEANKKRNKEAWEKIRKERPKVHCRYPGCDAVFDYEGNFKYCTKHRGKYYVPKKDRTPSSNRQNN